MKTALELSKVSVSYGENGAIALKEVDLQLPAGMISVIIGPNGSGKSTLIKAILDLIPYQGKIELFGHPVNSQYHHIGYLPQRFSFDRTIPITVYELLLLSLTECNCDNGKLTTQSLIQQALQEVGVANLINDSLANLSGGQLQRVLLAKAIVHQPKLVILDEPESGIDRKGERTIYELLRDLAVQHQMTVVLVTHDLDLATQYADYVVALDHRVVAKGSQVQVINKKVMAKLYGHQ